MLDDSGELLPKGGLALNQLATIDLSGIDSRCKNINVIMACDVTNPLCGPDGASRVFGPQKGATDKQVEVLDKALHHFASVALPHLNIAPFDVAGFGAAGGTPLGLSLLFNIELKPGIEMVLDTLNASQVIEDADLVITGEGRMDNQTLQGKTPWGVASRANALKVPVIGIAGSLGTETAQLYTCMESVFGTVRAPQTLAEALAEAELNLTNTARNIAATLKLGMSLK